MRGPYGALACARPFLVSLLLIAAPALAACAANGRAASPEAAPPAPEGELPPGCGAYADALWRLRTTASMLERGVGGSSPPGIAPATATEPSPSPVRPDLLRERARILDQWALEARESRAVETPWGTPAVDLADRFAALASDARAVASAASNDDTEAVKAARASLDERLMALRPLTDAARRHCFPAGGHTDPRTIKRGVRGQFPAFSECFEAGLARDPSLHGRITVLFVIQHDGTVPFAVEDDSDLPDRQMASCLVSTFPRMVFPPPVGGLDIIQYPIRFSP